MPIYEYRCLDCGKLLEVMQKYSDEPVKNCPDCEGEVKKLISNTSFILKGTGWYVTDYASAERKKALDAEKDTNGKKISEAAAAKDNNGAKTASTVEAGAKESAEKN